MVPEFWHTLHAVFAPSSRSVFWNTSHLVFAPSPRPVFGLCAPCVRSSILRPLKHTRLMTFQSLLGRKSRYGNIITKWPQWMTPQALESGASHALKCIVELPLLREVPSAVRGQHPPRPVMTTDNFKRYRGLVCPISDTIKWSCVQK